MDFKSILITGGAGFVGSNLAFLFRSARPDVRVIVMDNLKRRGSELNLARMKAAGIAFYHGDIRLPDDFEELPDFDLLIDCSAEASVHSGLSGSPRSVLATNLLGTIHCLEAARARDAAFLFVSTSRVFPIVALNNLPFTEGETRFRWREQPGLAGFSTHGIAEGFPIDGARSFYGTSKLACEHLIQEYVYSYGMRALIDRCGVLAGPWQMSKVDQGVITLWVARHYFKRPLRYTGFGGQGKQVRDILHVHDFFELLLLQLEKPELWDGRVYNVGGGDKVSVSLRELTELCVQETRGGVPIASVPKTESVDLRIYLTDARKVMNDFGWRPTRDPSRIVRDIRGWIEEHRDALRDLLT
jgi:CDP-paratose 2-epimerase